ncbi:hypothetical protein GOP47_0019794 [Adiantum capillus-veneris]|uniref:Uncharacterized protein n=1 Tax=Adiantum capillus-veneris TaxID=13818 RepID=A0A9D4UD70_ADICA|nr:hypothetical protein GOP47_0019794 [Adiantum capillus-veneris]
MWKDKKRMCGTYFDLLHYHDKKPCAKVDEYLRTVEYKAVKIFKKIDGHSPQRTTAVRMMFRSFIANGKALRDVESHIGMVKDQETKEMILRRTEQYGKVTLEKFGLGDLFPLVSAGIFVLRHGKVEDGSDDDGHHSIPSTSIPLLHVVGLFGNLQRLGNNDPNKALHMACKDGLSWEKIVVIPCDAALMLSFVVLKKKIGQKKWTLVEGPTDPFEACVGATPTMLLQCDCNGSLSLSRKLSSSFHDRIVNCTPKITGLLVDT